MSDIHRARLQVATAALTRIQVARELLHKAVHELESVRFGIAPALDAAKRSADSAVLASEHLDNLIRRIPA